MRDGLPVDRAPYVPAELLVLPDDVKVATYDVSGSSEQELRRQMDALGPVDDEGRRWDALTRWNIAWSYPLRRGDGGCATGPVEVTVDIRYDLPRWADGAHADPRLRGRWARFLHALVAHENGHRQLVLFAARKVATRLSALPPQPTCQGTAAAANAEGHRIVDLLRKTDSGYDELSDHGLAQGTRFR